jgi:putative MATE family efflux protein
LSRQVWSLALPVLVEQFLLYLVGLSDTVLAGRLLSISDLAGVTVGNYVLFFLGSLLVVVSVGATAIVSRLVGAGDWVEVRRIVNQVMLLSWVVGASLSVAGIILAPWCVEVLNLSGVSATSATAYLRVILCVMPLQASLIAVNAALRGTGDTRTGMWVMAGVNLINVSFSWALVTGFGGLPRLGVVGIALGTAIAEGLGGLTMMAILARGHSGLHMQISALVPRRREMARLLRVSLPAAGESGTNAICQLWFLSLINRLGDQATAAHGVAIRCESIAYLTVTAFAVSAATLVGQNLGANQPRAAERAARLAWLFGVLVISGLGLVIWVEAERMIEFFVGGGRTEILGLGSSILRIVALALPSLATITVLSGALRGAGSTRWPWLIVLIGYLGVRMPLTYVLAGPPLNGGMGLVGAWIAMFADLVARSALVGWRFYEGSWRRQMI